ncbi:MAG: hypothetical protein ABI626_10290 [Sphingomicrobium sp.]
MIRRPSPCRHPRSSDASPGSPAGRVRQTPGDRRWGPPAERKSPGGHRLEPAQRGRRWNRGGDAQARDRHAQLRDFRLEQVEQHVPRGVGEHALIKVARAQPPGADDRSHGVGRNLQKVARDWWLFGRWRWRRRSGRKPRQGRGDPADFVAQLAQPDGIMVGRDIRQPVGATGVGQRHRQRGRSIGFVGVDQQLHAAIGEPRREDVKQVRRSRHDCPVTALSGVAVHMVEQAVHHGAAIALELNPQGRCRGLQVDSFGRLLQSHRVGDPDAAGFDRSSRAIERRRAVASDKNGRSFEANRRVLRVSQVGGHDYAPSLG